MRIVVNNTGEFTLILGLQVVSVYSCIEPTTYYCMAVNSHALPVYKKHRIASLLCIFETTITIFLFITVTPACTNWSGYSRKSS